MSGIGSGNCSGSGIGRGIGSGSGSGIGSGSGSRIDKICVSFSCVNELGVYGGAWRHENVELIEPT